MQESKLHGELRRVIKQALDEFSGRQINLDAEASKEAISYRIASDVMNIIEVVDENKSISKAVN